jgi:hypothetical protein
VLLAERLARGAGIGAAKGGSVPLYWLIPWSLVALSVVLVALIYWGGFVEERRNGRPRG